MPIAVSVAVSHNLYAMIGWGVVAGAVQLLTYVAARLALPQINQNIQARQTRLGHLSRSLSLGTGILNAGCIV
jgi:putative membrane protein